MRWARSRRARRRTASIIVDVRGERTKPDMIAACLAYGAVLRHYSFKKYLTKKTSDEGQEAGGNGIAATKDGLEKLVIHGAHPEKAKAAFEPKAVCQWRHSSPAISSTSRPTCSAPSSSPTRRSSKASALRSKSSTSKTWKSSTWARFCPWRRGACDRRGSPSWCGTEPSRSAETHLLRRQGRRLRYRRHLDQGGSRHGGHEGRHGRRCRRHRHDARACRAQGKRQCCRSHRLRREHAVGYRPCAPATS